MNIHIGTESQQTIDDRATDEFFPVTPCRLTQDDLRNLPITGHLDHFHCDIAATRTYHLSAKILGKQCMLFQAMQGCFPKFTHFSPILEETDEFAYK